MANLKTKHYSDALDSMCALVGIPTDRLSTENAELLRVSFNAALKNAWVTYPWIDLCPYGEARFVGNKLTYPNDLTKTANWTATAVTATANQLDNPLDGRTTVSKLLETSASSAHNVAHSAIALVPSTNYVYSAYVRANGRSHVYLLLNDGVTAHSCFFNVTTGVVGTQANCTGVMQNVGNGFYLCAMQFTTDAACSATSSSILLSISTDGSTLSYAGSATVGLYVWGATCVQTTNRPPNDAVIPYDQTGENRMESVLTIWKDNPLAVGMPRLQAYKLTPNGVNVINGNYISYATVNSAGVSITTNLPNPVYVYYRQDIPDLYGDTYDSTATYSVGNQVYFTNSSGDSDYYQCVAAASAGDTPETDTDKWTALTIPEPLFWGSVWQAYGDWLTADGAADKALGAYAMAQKKLDDQYDRENRLMGNDFPMKVSTHGSQQSRF